MEQKKPWFSKTILTNFAVAVVAFFGQEAVAEYSADKVMMVLGGINILLRLVTKDKIGLEE